MVSRFNNLRSVILSILLFGLNLSMAYGQTNPVLEAELLIQQGDAQDAIHVLDSYIDSNPTDAEAFIKRAMAHEMLGQSQKRERDLTQAKFLNPFAYMYISGRSRSKYYEKKQYEYDFDRVSANFRKSPINLDYYTDYLKEMSIVHAQDSIISLAVYHLSRNELDSAKLLIDKVEISKYNSAIVFDIEGLLLLKQNNIEDAIQAFSKSISTMPNFPLAYHNRAVAHKLNGDFTAAKADLEKAIGLNEDISVFYFTLAKLSEKLDDPNTAIKNYEIAIDKNPGYIEARTNYSILQKTLGNFNESIMELERIMADSDDPQKNHFISGGIYLSYGDYEKAITEFDKFLINFQGDSAAMFNRGLAKILMGNKPDGCQDIEDSLMVNDKAKRNEIYQAFCSN